MLSNFKDSRTNYFQLSAFTKAMNLVNAISERNAPFIFLSFDSNGRPFRGYGYSA